MANEGTATPPPGVPVRCDEPWRTSFERAIAEHGGSLHRFCRALTSTPDAADDLFQEALVAAMLGFAGFRGEASIKTWLFTIARNKNRRMSRRSAQRVERELTLFELGLAAGWGATQPDCHVQQLEDRDQLAAALNGLEPADRQVLVLRDLDELNTRETATVLGVSEPATRVRLHRARLRFAVAFRALSKEQQNDR